LRVHLAKAGHWIVGDDLYGGARHRGVKEEGTRALLNPPHLLLHAWQLHLAAGTSLGERIFEAPLPVPFCAALAELGMILPPTD
jgi:23S rRNA pseudouridine1911/1915/1917 synthase